MSKWQAQVAMHVAQINDVGMLQLLTESGAKLKEEL